MSWLEAVGQEAGEGITISRHLWLIWEFVSLKIFLVWEKSLYWICHNVVSVFYVLFFWPPGMWNLSSSDQGIKLAPSALEGEES